MFRFETTGRSWGKFSALEMLFIFWKYCVIFDDLVIFKDFRPFDIRSDMVGHFYIQCFLNHILLEPAMLAHRL